MSDIDNKFMKYALKMAKKGIGRTSPNPMVGAVIVRNGEVVASGFHKKAGGDHAEVEALKVIGGRAMPDDILYVTLEPCNHYGKTPPCTKAIIESGLKKVVIGMLDPNPGVSGGGSEYLAARGIAVAGGILEAECRRLNEAYIKFVTTGRPFVIAKSAMTMDGWTATSTGNSRWITNISSRQFVHALRDRVDGIMVGSGTILADDPSLTTRLKGKKGKDPIRIILDTNLKIPLYAKTLNHRSDSPTLVVVGDKVPSSDLKRIERNGVSPVVCPTRDGRLDLAALMDILGKMSVTSLLVEGGATLMGSMIRERLVDKFYIFKAPMMIAGDDGVPMSRGPGAEMVSESLMMKDIAVRRFGGDILVVGYPDYERHRN